MRVLWSVLLLLILAAPASAQQFAYGFSERMQASQTIDTVLVLVPVKEIVDDSATVVVEIDTSALAPRKYVVEAAPYHSGMRGVTADTLSGYVAVGDTITVETVVVRGPIYRGNGNYLAIRIRNTAIDTAGLAGSGDAINVHGGVIY